MASRYISKLTQSWPPCMQYYGYQVRFQYSSIGAPDCVVKYTWSLTPSVSPNSLQSGLQVCTIMASQVHLQSRLHMVSTLGQSRCQNFLVFGFEVHLQLHPIVAFRWTSKPFQALATASSDISCVNGYLSIYIDTRMRIQIQYMCLNNRWTMSSSYNFQVHLQRFQQWYCIFRNDQLWYEELPGLSSAL